MGQVTAGKKKVTMELDPKTIDALDRQTRLFFGGKNRGGVVDEAVAAVLDVDPDAAADLYEFCARGALRATLDARAADPVSAIRLRAKAGSFDALRRLLSTSLIDDREEFGEMTMQKENPFKKIELAGGRFEIVPGGTVVLNPAEEGTRRYAWGVWAFDVEAPCDQAGAADGKCVGPIMAYLSDRDDLYKYGQHRPARFVDKADAEDCEAQAAELQSLAISHLDENGYFGGRTYAIGWAKFDMFNPTSPAPMGASAGFQRKAE